MMLTLITQRENLDMNTARKVINGKALKAKLLHQIASTMYKIHDDDLEKFVLYCEAIGIDVDRSHLEHDGCLTLEGGLAGVEVIEEE